MPMEYPPVGQPGSRDFFTYATDPQTFTAVGQILVGQIQLQNDADFVLCWLAGKTSEMYTNLATAQQPAFRCLVKITDMGGQRILMDRAIPGEAIVSTVNNFLPLPVRHRFTRGGSIAWELTNNSATAALTEVRLAFVGYKEWA